MSRAESKSEVLEAMLPGPDDPYLQEAQASTLLDALQERKSLLMILGSLISILIGFSISSLFWSKIWKGLSSAIIGILLIFFTLFRHTRNFERRLAHNELLAGPVIRQIHRERLIRYWYLALGFTAVGLCIFSLYKMNSQTSNPNQLSRSILGDATADVKDRQEAFSVLKTTHTDFAKLNLTGLSFDTLDLGKYDFRESIFNHATIRKTELNSAKLQAANFRESYIIDSSFKRADLSQSIMMHAIIHDSTFTSAKLIRAVLFEADLRNTSFEDAILRYVNFGGASFDRVDLRGADLTGANLKGIEDWETVKSFKNTNITDVKNAPEGFVKWAIDGGAFIVDEKAEL